MQSINAQKGSTFSSNIERKIFKLEYVPKWLQTNHLTLLTIPWAILVIVSGYLAREYNPLWFLGTCVGIFGQHLSDFYDGKIGRARDTRLFMWAYYMDHFLDYVFFCSVFFSYFLVMPHDPKHYILLSFSSLLIFANHIKQIYLNQYVNDHYKISILKFGPTELKLTIFLGNLLVTIIGLDKIPTAMLIVSIFSGSLLIFRIINTARDLICKEGLEGKNCARYLNYTWLFNTFFIIGIVCITLGLLNSFKDYVNLFLSISSFTSFIISICLYLVVRQKTGEFYNSKILKNSVFLYFHRRPFSRSVFLPILFVIIMGLGELSKNLAVGINLFLMTYLWIGVYIIQWRTWKIDMENKEEYLKLKNKNS